MSDKQALHPITDQSASSPVKIEAPRELPNVILVNTSLKKLKYHLGKFDNVVKKRITPNALTKGEWGFKHTKAVFQKEMIPFLKNLKDIFNVFDKDLLNEVTEVQTVFNQMEAAVQQYHVLNLSLFRKQKGKKNGNIQEKCLLKLDMSGDPQEGLSLYKLKIAKSVISNIMEPSTCRGSNTSVAPSSSSIDLKLSKLSCGNVTISRVYYVEGLGHNLFSVGQFCDLDLEVAFQKHTCFVRNLEGVDLLSGYSGTNLFSLSIRDMMASSPICLLSKAIKTKSWLWHRRLSHLNFGAINHLARHGLVRGLPRLKLEKDHLCSACAIGKSKKQSYKPKSEDTNQEKLYLLHMDLCGPMCVPSVNEKRYILVIVDDYSRFTWVKFLASKDEAPDFIIKFLNMIQVRLNTTTRNIHTDNGTEFVNQTLRGYYEQDLMFQPLFDEFFSSPSSVAFPLPVEEAPALVDVGDQTMK
ncbi:retrovirus-related pol polyprotein from transposon TNT 1-94 [Tanacetum coccineum]